MKALSEQTIKARKAVLKALEGLSRHAVDVEHRLAYAEAEVAVTAAWEAEDKETAKLVKMEPAA